MNDTHEHALYISFLKTYSGERMNIGKPPYFASRHRCLKQRRPIGTTDHSVKL